MSVNRESNLVNNKKTKTGEKKPYSANPFSILRSVPPSTNEPVELNTGLAIYFIIESEKP